MRLPEETAKKVLPLAKKLGARLEEGLRAEGLNVVQNNGEAAGQTVMHFHVHLVPRYKNDTVDVKWAQGTLTEDDKNEILGLCYVRLQGIRKYPASEETKGREWKTKM